jgi:hypothetical protein
MDDIRKLSREQLMRRRLCVVKAGLCQDSQPADPTVQRILANLGEAKRRRADAPRSAARVEQAMWSALANYLTTLECDDKARHRQSYYD